ncbi:MAG: hypothetical protein COS68_01250 [Elusimicrobia bacterium CG06_land_8_20_14_3_00_38_11]|nr:MAG: hypothetical protein COS68_01250 [Elusimicrobia bacterium CG06_land_8_20_14_3_00_38_11]
MKKTDKNSQIIIYKTEDGNVNLQVKMEYETVWLSQKQMAELFQCSTDNVGLHLKNIFKEKELNENSVTEEYSVTAADGKEYQNESFYYNYRAIVSY